MARDLQLECAKDLHETLLMPLLMNGNETMLWKEREGSRVRTVQMDNLRRLLGIKIDRIPNAQIRKLCGVMKVCSCGLTM